MCSKEDMLDWEGAKKIEAEADKFASHLLMPLDDFRIQMNGDINIDSLGHCADRYRVSLTAAILKWLSYTEDKAVLVVSKDGFIDWSSSSSSAMKSGAFFKTKSQIIEIPNGTLAANTSIPDERVGRKKAVKSWFKNADTDAELTEMKIYSEQYDCTLSLLLLPRYVECWPSEN
jgi:Zn-dependent peptidase ImmA (M78 family)